MTVVDTHAMKLVEKHGIRQILPTIRTISLFILMAPVVAFMAFYCAPPGDLKE